jgi:hypothetical protein
MASMILIKACCHSSETKKQSKDTFVITLKMILKSFEFRTLEKKNDSDANDEVDRASSSPSSDRLLLLLLLSSLPLLCSCVHYSL